MPRIRTVLSAAAVLVFVAPAARADLVRHIDGTTYEGKVTKNRDGSVKIKGYKKTLTFPASEVKFVEEAELSWDVYNKRSRAVPADLTPEQWVDERLKLARYLEERLAYCPDLRELLDKEFESILRKAPDCAEAHEGLDHVQWAGKWFKNEADRDKYRKNAPPAEMEPLGYVKYKKSGMWEKAEDIEALEQGKVKYNGQWMTPDEVQIAKGYVKDESGKWVYARDLAAAERSKEVAGKLGESPESAQVSEHFRFISWFPVGETAQLKDLAERSWKWYTTEVLGMGTEEFGSADSLFTEPLDVFVLRAQERKDKLLDSMGGDFGIGPENMDFYKKGSGWHRLNPMPYMIISGDRTEKNRSRDPEKDYTGTTSSLTSMVGRILLDRIRGNSPPWLHEGNAFLCEIEMNETADTCYVSKTEYRESVADKAGSKAKYFEFMKNQIQSRQDRSMRQLFTMELNKLDWADSVKSWSFLKFLLAEYRTQFRVLLRAPMPQPEFITPAQVKAAIDGALPKDPAAAARDNPGAVKKDEGPVPTENLVVRGPGAINVTEDSKESRAITGASAELWIQEVIGKDIETLENEWKGWVLKQ